MPPRPILREGTRNSAEQEKVQSLVYIVLGSGVPPLDIGGRSTGNREETREVGRVALDRADFRLENRP